MESAFLSELRVQKIGPRWWKLTDDLLFFSKKYGYCRALADYETNFGSIPRIAWVIFPPVDEYDPATVIHDAGYNNALKTIMGRPIFTVKFVADDLFLEGLIACGVNEAKAKLMYLAVSKFGRPDGPLPGTV